MIHGGGLAIATALVSGDRGGPALCFVMAPYPQIDGRSDTPPSLEIVDVGDRDMFLDEDVDFANRLQEAGVLTESHVYAGVFHASEVFAPTAALSHEIWGNRLTALRRALGSPAS